MCARPILSNREQAGAKRNGSSSSMQHVIQGPYMRYSSVQWQQLKLGQQKVSPISPAPPYIPFHSTTPHTHYHTPATHSAQQCMQTLSHTEKLARPVGLSSSSHTISERHASVTTTASVLRHSSSTPLSLLILLSTQLTLPLPSTSQLLRLSVHHTPSSFIHCTAASRSAKGRPLFTHTAPPSSPSLQ